MSIFSQSLYPLLLHMLYKDKQFVNVKVNLLPVYVILAYFGCTVWVLCFFSKDYFVLAFLSFGYERALLRLFCLRSKLIICVCSTSWCSSDVIEMIF